MVSVHEIHAGNKFLVIRIICLLANNHHIKINLAILVCPCNIFIQLNMLMQYRVLELCFPILYFYSYSYSRYPKNDFQRLLKKIQKFKAFFLKIFQSSSKYL